MANQPTEQLAPADKSEKNVDDEASGETTSESDVPGTEPDEDIPDEEATQGNKSE